LALLCTGVCLSSEAEGAGWFGSRGEAAGQFIEPNGIAVERGSGNIVILDSNNHRIERYTKNGAFLRAWGWGVADGKTEAMQTCATTCHAGLEGTGAGQLGFAEGVAIDNDPLSPSYRDVYVVDIGNHRVEKFGPSGEFMLMLGGSVNATAHERGEAANEDVCPVNPGDRCKEGAIGPGKGQFEFPVEGDYIAVGSSGVVYVGDRNRVQEFGPGGNYESQVTLTPQPEGSGSEVGGTAALAVDGVGDLYVVRNGVRGVRKYGQWGEQLQTLDEQGVPEYNEGPTPAIAPDSSGNIFIDDNAGDPNPNAVHRILECDSTGRMLASFDMGMEDGVHGIAFNETIGKLYVVNANNNVTPVITRVRFVSPPAPPSVFSNFEPWAWCSGRALIG
jgi:DNA-binding beta-propeller fold protein YncE